MVLQSSGAISLLDIANEFNGTAPHSISEYYGSDSGIPTSGTISFSNFYGKGLAWIWYNYYSYAGTVYGPVYVNGAINGTAGIDYMTHIGVKLGYRVVVYSQANFSGYISGDFDNRTGTANPYSWNTNIPYGSAKVQSLNLSVYPIPL